MTVQRSVRSALLVLALVATTGTSSVAAAGTLAVDQTVGRQAQAARAELLEQLHAAGSLLGPGGNELARAATAATSLSEIRRLAAQLESALSLDLRSMPPPDRSAWRIQVSPGSTTLRTAIGGMSSTHSQLAPRPVPGGAKYPMRGTWLPSPDAD